MPYLSYEKLLELFYTSNKIFTEKEKNLILSWVSERSLCWKLAFYLNNEIIKSEFKNYHVDIEYNRNYEWKIKTIIDSNLEVINITCDIIIHSRWENTNQDNLIAIEMKKSVWKIEEKNKDRNRLIALTKKSFNDTWSFDWTTLPEHVCGYILWIYYEVDIHNKTILIEEYKRWKLKNSKIINF